MIRKGMTWGVLQGSVLGPRLRNIAFDGILKEDAPPGVGIMAEDNTSMLVWKVNIALGAMTHWIGSAKSSNHKDGSDIVYTQLLVQQPSFCLKGKETKLCTVPKYLGLEFDEKLTFTEHARWTAAKVERIVTSISRLMSNLGLSCWQTLSCWSPL